MGKNKCENKFLVIVRKTQGVLWESLLVCWEDKFGKVGGDVIALFLGKMEFGRLFWMG